MRIKKILTKSVSHVESSQLRTNVLTPRENADIIVIIRGHMIRVVGAEKSSVKKIIE